MNADDDYLRQIYREEMENLRDAIRLVGKKKKALESENNPDEHKIQIYELRLEELKKSIDDIKKKARIDGVIVL